MKCVQHTFKQHKTVNKHLFLMLYCSGKPKLSMQHVTKVGYVKEIIQTGPKNQSAGQKKNLDVIRPPFLWPC